MGLSCWSPASIGWTNSKRLMSGAIGGRCWTDANLSPSRAPAVLAHQTRRLGLRMLRDTPHTPGFAVLEGRSMTPEQIREVLALHAKWLRGETGGSCANLRGADLRSADLRGA